MNLNTHRADILIVDDTPANLQLLTTTLSKHGYNVRAVTDGRHALMAARAVPPDLILLDIMMPEMDGFQVCAQVKADAKLKDIPIIFISALDETVDKVHGFQLGGADYVSKPFKLEEVLARMEIHLTLYHQRRQLEQAREQDRLYFEKISQLKDEFVSTASHDLKNPLTNIKLSVDLLRRAAEKNDPHLHQKYLANIYNQVERMQQLITDLLDIVKLETGRALVREKVNIRPFLQRVVDDFALVAQESHLELVYESPATELIAHIDPQQLGQALHNLLSNAIKYTPKGGRVQLAAEQHHEQMQITVQDTGLGIPEADIPHVFEKFYRVADAAHMSVEGTGLGLSIVQTVVEQHGGRVHLASQLGQGSVFTILVPNPNS
ncbi:MAG: hybrid sensor histidine kinase/response regulator [Chloroflexi bacterium]|nr:hybrid sensor histidine kinase/response regulator [Chloroflexota bacterium]